MRIIIQCDDDRVIRVDGLHCFADLETAVKMYQDPEPFDVAKFADDVPAQLSCEVYKVKTLRCLVWDYLPPDALPDGNFSVQDVTEMSFSADHFDSVVSMETFDHVDADKYLSEIKRVLKPGGNFIMSTPQNCIGDIPINAQHGRDYRLEEVTSKVEEYFGIKKIFGIKAGRIVIAGDPIGANTVLACTNPKQVEP